MQVQDNLRIYPTSCDPIGSPHIPTITKCMYDSAGGSPAWHANPHIPCQILGRSLGVEVKSYHRSYGLPVLVTRWEPSTCNCRTNLFSMWWHATPAKRGCKCQYGQHAGGNNVYGPRQYPEKLIPKMIMMLKRT